MNGLAGTVVVVLFISLGWLVLRGRRNAASAPLPSRVERSRNELRLARRATQAGRFDEAESHYQAALDDADSPSSFLEIGTFHSDRGRSQKAIESYESAFRLRGTTEGRGVQNLDVVLRYGEACLALGRRAQAERVFRYIVGLPDVDPSTQFLVSASFSQLRSSAHVRAVASVGRERRWRLLDTAIQIDPQNWDAYRTLIKYRWADGMARANRAPALRALDRFRRAVARIPDSLAACTAFARTLSENGRERGAVVYFSSRMPSFPAVARDRAKAVLAGLRNALAQSETLKKAIEADRRAHPERHDQLSAISASLLSDVGQPAARGYHPIAGKRAAGGGEPPQGRKPARISRFSVRRVTPGILIDD